MKHLATIFYSLILIFVCNKSIAETWNEPWQKEIIKNADYFVFGKVIVNDENGTKVEIIKSFSDKLSGTILINGFSMLTLSSASGHGVHLNFEKEQLVYLFLNKRNDGNFAIPTPTSGYAILDDKNNVTATYRHSYHQASISKDVYEMTYSEIWDHYKNKKYNQEKINAFINEQLSKEPAGFDENEISTFFLQHTALETAYLLDISIELSRVKKFIVSNNFHARVSALQALTGTKDQAAKDFLFEYISEPANDNFEKVIAIWALKKSDQSYLSKLKKLSSKLSDEETGFGGNIMDPRIATHFPTPKSAAGFYD